MSDFLFAANMAEVVTSIQKVLDDVDDIRNAGILDFTNMNPTLCPQLETYCLPTTQAALMGSEKDLARLLGYALNLGYDFALEWSPPTTAAALRAKGVEVLSDKFSDEEIFYRPKLKLTLIQRKLH